MLRRYQRPDRVHPVRTRALGLFLLALALPPGCDLFPEAPPDDEVLDGPIEGLTTAQRAAFFRGDEEFNRIFSFADGLGPVFVAHACAACHPGDGDGHPAFNLTRFGRMLEGGRFDPMPAHGGPQIQNRAMPGYEPEVVPPEATGVTRLTAPSVTGLGLLEAVDDATLLALADPDDADGDGISGRVQLIDSTDFIAEIVSLDALVSDEATRGRLIPIDGKYIGRFGKKAVSINLLHQTVSAYSLDMGLTTDLIPQDLFNPAVGGFATDEAADPEVSSAVVEHVVFYLRTLRPPPRREADHPDVLAGERLFSEIGCVKCHVSTLRTGRSEIAALNEVEFHPYTDLLLHDMGPELDDGYTEGRALTSEWRTAPLWGIGLAETFQGGTGYYLHDGRATSLAEAIEFHGGEASASRAAFQALSEKERAQVIRFLRSL